MYNVLGRDSTRRRNAQRQVAFFRFPRSFSAQQTGEAGHNVGTELLKGRSPLCGQRESVIGKRNLVVDKKVGSPSDDDSTMCIADALFIRDRYRDTGDRFIRQWEPSCNTLPKNIRKDDQKVTCAYRNCVGMRMLFFGKTIQEENKLIQVHVQRFLKKKFGTSGMFANLGFGSALYSCWKVHRQSLRMDKKNRSWTVFGRKSCKSK